MTTTILIVDDEPVNIALLSNLLKPSYQVRAATSGVQALHAASLQPPPALILLDIMMPDMDGYQVLERLQQQPELRDIPVIFVTALSESKDEEQGLLLGAVDYISKPIKPAVVMARVRTHLELKQARDSLKEKNQHLLQLNQEKDQILHMASHDLKTPLSSIVMLAELMERKQGQLEAAKVLEYARILHTEADYILNTLNDFVDLNKAASGDLPVHFEPVYLQALLQDLRENYQAKANKKDIQLTLDLQANTLPVQNDFRLLWRTLENLLSNAVKFSPPGREVLIQLQQIQGQPEVLIKDQGPGFSAADQTRMYHKFARLSARPTAGEPSTGLGLALVRELTQILQIELNFASQPGMGSSFSLRFKPSPASDLNPKEEFNYADFALE